MAAYSLLKGTVPCRLSAGGRSKMPDVWAALPLDCQRSKSTARVARRRQSRARYLRLYASSGNGTGSQLQAIIH